MSSVKLAFAVGFAVILSALSWACAAPARSGDKDPAGSPQPTASQASEPATSPSPLPTASPAVLAPKAKKSGPKASSKKSAAPAFLPQILQEVEAKYALAKTLQAEFSQVNEVASLKTKKSSNGKIEVKRPDKLRWETITPDANLLVSDGQKFWFYTPPFDPTEHGQVVERKSSQIQSKLANALLSGSFSIAHDMKIEAEGAFKFVLTPKPGSAGTVKKAWIEINPSERLIQKVIIEHRGGNRSEITLSKIELGVDLGDDRFVFTAPANTDKVDP